MHLIINDVKQCKNKAMGNYCILGKGVMRITVSLKLNRLLADYMLTLLHEMLHAWFTLVRVKGFRCTDRLEHKIIYKIEEAVFRIIKQHIKNNKQVKR